MSNNLPDETRQWLQNSRLTLRDSYQTIAVNPRVSEKSRRIVERALMSVWDELRRIENGVPDEAPCSAPTANT